MLIYTNQRSKKKNKTKKQIAEYQEWLDSVNKQTTNFSRGHKTVSKSTSSYKPQKPFVRETPHYPSLATAGADCTKPIHGKCILVPQWSASALCTNQMLCQSLVLKMHKTKRKCGDNYA